MEGRFPGIGHRLVPSEKLPSTGGDSERAVAVELETDAQLAMSRY